MQFKLYKHPKFGHVYGPTFKAPKARAAWVSLVSPKAPPPPKPGDAPGTPRYEVTLLLDKSSDKSKMFLARVAEVAKVMETLFNTNRKGSKVSLGEYYTDGDEFIKSREDYAEKYSYYKGKYVIVVRNANQPKILGQETADKEDLSEIDPTRILAGMEVRAWLCPMFTSYGVSYKLEAVQLHADDGTRYGGGAPNFAAILKNSEDEFGDKEDNGIVDDSEEVDPDEEDDEPFEGDEEEEEEEVAEEEEETPKAAKMKPVKQIQQEVNLAPAKNKAISRKENMKAMLNKM